MSIAKIPIENSKRNLQNLSFLLPPQNPSIEFSKFPLTSKTFFYEILLKKILIFYAKKKIFLSKSLNLHVRISQVHFHKTKKTPKNYKILKLFFVLSDSFNTLISILIFIMNVKEIKFRGRYGLFNTKNWLFVTKSFCVLYDFDTFVLEFIAWTPFLWWTSKN